MEFDESDGYFISNADVDESWDCLPTVANAEQPPIRIQNIPCVEGHEETRSNLDDFVTSLKDNGFHDPMKTIGFKSREEYLHALRGESEDWKLIGIRVDDVEATLEFVHKDDRFYGEPLFLSPTAGGCINLLIEVDGFDGSVDRYQLYMEDGQYGKMIKLTEYEPWGYREIYFKNRTYIPEHPDSSYFYAHVVEHKR